MNYNHLYYFHVAATEGSLSAAAATLGVKQSTVSEQLRSLEKTLRQTLFERSPQGMRLTAAGQVAYEHTTTMFRAGDRLIQALGDDKKNQLQTLRVGTSGAVARATSTDFLLPLFALDDWLPTIVTGDMTELLQQLRANELDLVLCELEPPEAATRSLQHVAIDHIPLIAIAPPKCDPGPDWRDIGLIHYRPSSSFHWEVENFLEANGLKPRIVGEADDPFLLVEGAARGGHVVIVPRSVARDALATGRVRVLAQIESAHAAVHALYQDGASAEMARRAIEELIANVKASTSAS